uniref:Uncharacterized protein n=1 Tax=Cacopsylla melanoneura TaxID=428564 RepID=A0A8D9A0I6_9HEMI
MLSPNISRRGLRPSCWESSSSEQIVDEVGRGSVWAVSTGGGTESETGVEGGGDSFVVKSSFSSDFTFRKSSELSLLSCSSSSAWVSFFFFGGVGKVTGVVGVTVNLVPLRVVDGVIPLARGTPCCCNAFSSVLCLRRLVLSSSLGAVFFGF